VLIRLLPTSGGHKVPFNGVVDVTDLGDLVGLEILDFRSQLGSAEPSPSAGDGLPRWTYDEEMDAFYVRVADGTADTQRTVVGTAALDGDGRVTQIRIPS